MTSVLRAQRALYAKDIYFKDSCKMKLLCKMCRFCRHPVLCPHQLIERNVVQKSAVPPTTLMRRYTLRLLWNEEL